MSRWAFIAALLAAWASASFAGVIVKKEKRWPLPQNRRIPFFIDANIRPDLPSDPCESNDQRDRCKIRNAMKRWNTTAAGIIEFEEISVPPSDKAYVLVRKPRTTEELRAHSGAAGWAGVGYQGVKAHDVVLAFGNRNVDEGTVLHEFAHVVGLDHEHQHRDRNKYINFTFSSLLETLIREKSWYTESTKIESEDRRDFLQPYDFRSIMHYVAATGWEPHREGPKLLEQQGLTAERVGHISGLSTGDWRSLRALYCDVPEDCPFLTPAQNRITDRPVEALFPKPPQPPRTEMHR